MLKSLNQVLWIKKILFNLKYLYYKKFWGMDIDKTVLFSLRINLDKTYPKGIHIDQYSYIAFDVAILTHDRTRGIYTDTYIGKNCFIGARSIVLPGVSIGDGCVIGAGSVVTKNVPPNCIAAGNPARVIREGIGVGQYGRFAYADTPVELRPKRVLKTLSQSE